MLKSLFLYTSLLSGTRQTREYLCVIFSANYFQWNDRTQPVDKHVEVLSDTYGITAAPLTPQIFGGAGKEHMEKYGMLLSIRFDHCLEHRIKFLSSSVSCD